MCGRHTRMGQQGVQWHYSEDPPPTVATGRRLGPRHMDTQSSSCHCIDMEPVAHQEQMAMGHLPPLSDRNTGGFSFAAAVPGHDNRLQDRGRPELASGDLGGNEIIERGTPTNSNSHGRGYIFTNCRHGARDAEESCPHNHVVFDTTSRLRPPARSPRCQDPAKQRITSRVSERQGSFDTRSELRDRDTPVARSTQSSSRNVAAVQSGHCVRHTTIQHDEDFSSGQPTVGSALNPQRCLTDFGTGVGSEQHTPVVLRTQQGGDFAPLPELGHRSVRHETTNGRGGRLPSPARGRNGWSNFRGRGVEEYRGFVPSWPALLGKKRKVAADEIRLHLKGEVVGSLDDTKVLQLPLSTHVREMLLYSTRWIKESSVYDEIAAFLGDIIRTHSDCITSPHTELLVKAKKYERATGSVSWCNTFIAEEEKEEGGIRYLRGRPIIEPLINDILQQRGFDVTTKYTSKEEIRRSVLTSEAALLFDYKAWFDQIRLAPGIRKFFGVQTQEDEFQLTVVPMGYRPACQTANALTRAIGDVDGVRAGEIDIATCVDNVRFAGSVDTLKLAEVEFKNRCAMVGAQLNESNGIQVRYDFLGETYDHNEKTRKCTAKVQQKAETVLSILAPTLRVRQVMAILGLLLYGASTLQIPLAQFHGTFRFVAGLHSRPLGSTVKVPQAVLDDFTCWAGTVAKNDPVPVFDTTSELRPDLVLYTDASAHGWGVVAIKKSGSVMAIGERWTVEERIAHDVTSSAVAEPLAIRKAVARLVTTDMIHVRIFTDHQPFVFAARKGVGKTLKYSAVLEALQQYPNTFTFEYVEGKANPADIYSRLSAPILEVTHIGFKKVPEGVRYVG